ncbi:MAG: O-antigen ligase family protein [Alphaproteobacteria bacterium]
MSMTRVRNATILAVIGLYLVLNYGFMLIRIPPASASGVPVGEVILVLALLGMNHFRVISRLQATVFLFPFLLWWTYGIGRALSGFSDYGFWALRDATHEIESLFLLVGFAFATRAEHLDRFFRWLPWMLGVGAVYALSFPFADTLMDFAPTIRSAAGHTVPVLFNYTSTSVLLLMGAAWLMLFRERTKVTVALQICLIGYAAFVFQARTIYLQIFALMIFFAAFRREAVGKGILGMIVIVLALLALPLTGIDIEGRLGQKVSFDFIVNHILSIGGVESSGLRGTARGVSLRMVWWNHIIANWSASFENMMLGLGFGMPLTNHHSLDGAIVREPHNSYLSVLGRTGLIGLFAFLWMHVLMIRAWWRAYRTSVRAHWREGQNRLLILMVFFILIWVYAMGEDALEKPYFAISYYFFWGIALKMAWQVARHPASARDSRRPLHGAPGAAPGVVPARRLAPAPRRA